MSKQKRMQNSMSQKIDMNCDEEIALQRAWIFTRVEEGLYNFPSKKKIKCIACELDLAFLGP